MLLQEGMSFQALPEMRNVYNVSAWRTTEHLEGPEPISRTHMLGRKVVQASQPGEPDVGSLVFITVGPEGISSTPVWEPKPNECLLEDPRVLRLADGTMVFGLTAVDSDGFHVPHPAVLITTQEELTRGVLGKPEIITQLGGGDQTTPVGESVFFEAGKNVTAIDGNTFVFRPEGAGNNHHLRVFEYVNGRATRLQTDIQLPEDIPWALYRTGTTIPPIWLNDREAIFPIHGITIDEAGKYIYSIGSARLTRAADGTLSVDCISDSALIYPDLFVSLFADDEDPELHSNRRVVYCCGGIPNYDAAGELTSVTLYVNVGDKQTVEVMVTKSKLTENWPESTAFGRDNPAASQ